MLERVRVRGGLLVQTTGAEHVSVGVPLRTRHRGARTTGGEQGLNQRVAALAQPTYRLCEAASLYQSRDRLRAKSGRRARRGWGTAVSGGYASRKAPSHAGRWLRHTGS